MYLLRAINNEAFRYLNWGACIISDPLYVAKRQTYVSQEDLSIRLVSLTFNIDHAAEFKEVDDAIEWMKENINHLQTAYIRFGVIDKNAPNGH